MRDLIRKNARLFLFAALAVIIGLAYTRLNTNSNLKQQPNISFQSAPMKQSSAETSPSLSDNDNIHVQESSSPISKLQTQPETLGGTPADIAKIGKWKESRGYFSQAALADYGGYDLDTLRKLASTGDLKAMTALARFYLSDKYQGADPMQNYIGTLSIAAVYGSTDALVRLSLNYASIKEGAHSAELSHEDLIEVLALRNVAAMRGDLWPNVAASEQYKNPIAQLNKGELDKIRERSQVIYDDFLRQRKLLGLGEFDNTRPPEVDKFFGYFESYLESKK